MKGTNARPGRPAVIRIKLIDNWPPPVRVNEFYKKRCQEKTSTSTGGREDFSLEIQPTAVSVPPDSLERFCFGCLPSLCRCGVHLPNGHPIKSQPGPLFHIAEGDGSEQHAFGSDKENHSVVRRKTEWNLASRALPPRRRRCRNANLNEHNGHWRGRPTRAAACRNSSQRSGDKVIPHDKVYAATNRPSR